MDNIIYIDETVTEKVFEGDLILDGHMTLQEQNESIFQTMRNAGIPVENEDEYLIGYVGAEDNNGISETQTSHYVVTRTYQKPVPYREKREEIYNGIWILDGLRMSPEEQRKKILDVMKKDGIDVEKEDEIEIRYEGADDNYGESETQSTKFVVYRVTKEKLTGEEKEIAEEEHTLQEIYEELITLGEKLHATTNAEEIARLSDRITELSSKMDELVAESSRDYEPFEEALNEMEEQINALYETISAYNTEYEQSYDRMKKIEEEYMNMTKEDSSEYEQKIKELIAKAKAENTQSMEIRKSIKQQTEELSKLLKKKNRIRKDFNMAQQLGISAMEYKEITDSFRSRKLVAAIIEKKGLGDLIAIPASERTPEQKRQIRAIRQEILEELAQAKKEKKESSILDLVEALYGVETEVSLRGKQRVLIVRPTSLENIKKNITKMPEKIMGQEEVDKSYTPGEAPEDMKDVMESRTDEIHPVIDRFVFFKDARYPDKIFARANVFERFDVEELGPGVRINNALCYEMSKEDAEKILANRENDYSPYIVQEEEATIEGELEVGKALEKTMVEESSASKREILPSEESDEFIPGTNFKRPRYRGNDETDEEYVSFLKDYYSRLFGTGQEAMAQTNVTPESGLIEEDVVEAQEEQETAGDTPIEETNTTNQTTERYTIFRDADNQDNLYARKFLFDRFDIDPIGEGVRIAGALCYPISREDLEAIEANRENDYSPYHIEYMDVKVTERQNQETNLSSIEVPPIVEESLETRGAKEKFEIFRDKDNPNRFYAYKPVFERFDAEPLGEEIRLGDVAGNEIHPEDVNDIIHNQNNDYSPYEVEIKDISFGKEQEPVVPTNREDRNVSLTSGGAKEKFVIFRDKDNPNKFYAYKPVFERFDAEPLGEEIRLGDVAGNEIHPEDVNDIINNQNNDYSPYEVEIKDISFGKEQEPVVPTGPVPTTPPEEKTNVELITLYRDTNDNNQVYAPDRVLRKFGIRMAEEPTIVNGEPCHKISRDTDQIINSIAKMSKSPKLEVRYVDVKVKTIEPTHVKPHVEAILDVLTEDLDIRAKDAKRYQASNLRISKSFREELHSGNYAYNIVHVVPAILKAGISVFRKLAGKLMTRARAQEAMGTIEERLASLSEEELDVLFEEYKGTQLKTDMNNQINPLILDRLKRYGLERVASLNQAIQQDYVSLFGHLGQINALEERIQQNGGDTQTLENQRMVLMQEAAQHIKSIIENRNKANNILSSGVHGIEEDFKAVASKMNYVGMRFGRANDFDNELQHQLGVLGQNLNIAIANGDSEAIVQNFMGLESCYYDNTEIRGSIAGRRSVGSKYYSPVAEQFDYRDDPFIRDLFTTIAVTSAAVSAINAIRVHQIESQQVLSDQQAQANTINTQNQAAMDQVHQTADQITGKRDTFQQGMEAQAEQDILTHADVRERAHLDLTNWHFNRAYRAADDAGHAAYNQFGADVTKEINAVTSDYAQGVITQAEALEKMAQISNDAQNTLQQVVDSSLQILRPYKATHPQFDLTAVEQSMDYLVKHPNAITDMNEAIVDVTNMAEGLKGLQATQMTALSSLPSDMASTIVCAASAAVLAANVSASMKQTNRKGQYGNEITDMMNDYLYGTEEEEMERYR
ncbi:MAG: hypothetical protein IKF71_04655 [Bacilli bacterium]|nr:hypothetical protein [Bacilli bacterium]